MQGQGTSLSRSNDSGPDADKHDFWDSFGDSAAGPPKEKQDFWDSFGAAPNGPDTEKKGFWDDFAAAGEARQRTFSGGASGGLAAGIGTGMGKVGGAITVAVGGSASVGTSAMKASKDGPGTMAQAGGQSKKKDDDWGEW